MIEFFDYIYYRTYQWYKKKNDPHPGLMGRLIISLSVLLNLYFLVATLADIFPIYIDFVWLKWGFGILFLLLAQVLKIRYRKRTSIEWLNNKYTWEKERPEDRRRRGFLVITYVIGSLAIPIIWGIVLNN